MTDINANIHTDGRKIARCTNTREMQIAIDNGHIAHLISGTAFVTVNAGNSTIWASGTATISGVRASGTATISDVRAHDTATISGVRAYGTATISDVRAHDTATISDVWAHDTATISDVRAHDTATISGVRAYGTATISGVRASGTATISGVRASGTATISDVWAHDTATISDVWAHDTATISDVRAHDTATISGVRASGTATISDVRAYDTATISEFAWLSSTLIPDSSLPFVAYRAPSLDQARVAICEVAEFVKNDLAAFEMSKWHSNCFDPIMNDYPCGTTHCMAGAAIALAGDKGRRLEAVFGSAFAGELLLGSEAAAKFYASKDDALAFLNDKIGEQAS